MFPVNVVIVISILLCYCASVTTSVVIQSQNQYSRCISEQNLATLETLAKSRVNSTIKASVNCVCTPNTSPSDGGWDITCFDAPFSSLKKQKNDPFAHPIRVNGSKGPLSSIGSTEFDLNKLKSNSGRRSMDATLPTSSSLAFTMKNENWKVVEISCYSAILHFTEAMFQGKFTLILFNFFFIPKCKITHKHFNFICNCNCNCNSLFVFLFNKITKNLLKQFI